MNINDLPVILASGSPRRIEMLKADGLDPFVLKPDCDETLHTPLAPHQTVMALALKKGLAAAQALAQLPKAALPFAAEETCLMISSDTVVAKGGRIFGKPQSKEEARAMLCALRGDVHQVYSGVLLQVCTTDKKLLFYEKTDVYVKDVSDRWIEDYIATKEPYDKAGAYAIQGAFGCHIDRIEGCYDNVVGLPYERLKQELAKLQL